MSSREFSAQLVPESRLRSLVMLSGALAALGGFVLIIDMPLAAGLRAALAITWIVYCGRGLWDRSRAASRVTRIGVNNLGDAWIVDRSGRRSSVELLAGTVVIGRLAWLRMRFADGRDYAELLRGNSASGIQWHRFQLIWQQCRQMFGHAE